MRIALLLVVLIAPASAQITWQATDAVAGEPVHAAWMDVAQESPLVLNTHVDADVRVLLDDALLFESSSIHEHDGLHTLTLTPPGPGTLRFEAIPRSGEPVVHEIEVLPARPATVNESKAFEAYTVTDESSDSHEHRLRVNYQGQPLVEPYAFYDVRDAQGRLVFSTSGGAHTFSPAWSGDLPASEADIFLQGDGPTLGGRLLTIPIASMPGNTGRVIPVQSTPCEGVITDPESVLPGELVWQQWSDVRIAVPGAPSVLYGLEREDPQGDALLLDASAEDGFGSLTFRVPEPGLYRLRIFEPGGMDCSLPFRVLPGQDSNPGTVEADVTFNGTLEATYTPVRDGQALGHYEFDVRVMSEHGLHWKGKLHGHAGTASFTMENLPYGNYTVIAYPSPQAVDAPPVDTGHVAHFTHMAPAGQPAREPTQDTPMPLAAAVVALAMATRSATRRQARD